MLPILKYFWQMCLLRSGPDRIPSQPLILVLALIFYLLADVVGGSLARPSQSIASVLGIGLIDATIFGVVTFLLLSFMNLSGRFIATYTALLGTGIFMVVIQVPFILIRYTETSILMFFAESVALVCFGWWLVIIGHIYHRAANISILQGSAIGLVIMILIATAVFMAFPPPQQIQQFIRPSAL
ncbi:MAG TPA: hypothetical protein DCM54_04505 [Gammaproteobacteria bacterium]|nr:hypothetical protein [Gammaproteobacteria bacterium]